MPAKKQKLVRVSVFFTNEQAVPFELDPKVDKFTRTPEELVVKRGNGDTINVSRAHVAYYVVSKFEREVGEKHPAFPKEGETDGLDLI